MIMSTSDAEMLLAGVSVSGNGATQQSVIDDMVATVLSGGKTEEEFANYTLKNGDYKGANVTVTIREISTTSEIEKTWNGWFDYSYSSIGQWKQYSDEYTVPAGQYATRFFLP